MPVFQANKKCCNTGDQSNNQRKIKWQLNTKCFCDKIGAGCCGNQKCCKIENLVIGFNFHGLTKAFAQIGQYQHKKYCRDIEEENEL